MNTMSIKKKILIIISLFAIIFSGFSLVERSATNANAFGLCSKVGSSMSEKEVSTDKSRANADFGNRKWTVEELFRNSVSFSSFYGEGPKTTWFAEKKNRGEKVDGWSNDVQKKFEEVRGFSCIFGGWDGIPQMMLSIAGALTSLTSLLINALVGKDFMAETLTNIVGGKSKSDGGLISTFMNSFYLPLVVIVSIFMVSIIVYKGLIKRQLRESLSSIIWTFGAFIIGVTLMLSPKLLASIPQNVTSTITSCVIGSLSGQNCISGKVATPSLLAGNECISTVGNKNANGAESMVNGMNCTIWKAFVLEPWAEEQFGEPYTALYTKSPPKGGTIWRNLPKGQGSKYCVNFKSSKSMNDTAQTGPKMNASGAEICNVALYHLFIKTEMTDTVSQDKNNKTSNGVILSDDTGSYDKRWYDIAIPMAQDSSNWKNWSGDDRLFSRIATSTMSLITVILASSVLLTLAVFGGAYKTIGLILMAFAPIFFLIAMEPTRGRKIFLGWLETAVSSFLKYFAITVLIIVSLVLYSGVLSNTSGIQSLIGVIILTAALHMYRKEIIDLIGASNMGGQKLSNKVNSVGSKALKKVGDKGKYAAGGLIGGAVGAAGDTERKSRINQRKGTINSLSKALSEATVAEEGAKTDEEKAALGAQREELENKLRTEEQRLKDEGTVLGHGLTGAKDSLERSMKRGTGLAAATFAQKGRTQSKLERLGEQDKKNAEKLIEESAATSYIPSSDANVLPEIDGEVSEVAEKQGERIVAVNNLRDSIREPVQIPEELSEEEKEELHKFADQLKANTNDNALANLAKSEEVIANPVKREMVAKEINARIQSNSMIGVASNSLSRTGLTDQSLLSEEELRLNVKIHSENFLETGDTEQLERYLNSGQELSDRLNVQFDRDEASNRITDFREDYEGEYTRNPDIPREEELNNLESFEVRMNENEVVSSNSVTPSETIQSSMLNHQEALNNIRSIDSEIARIQNNGTIQNDEKPIQNNQTQIVVPDSESRSNQSQTSIQLNEAANNSETINSTNSERPSGFSNNSQSVRDENTSNHVAQNNNSEIKVPDRESRTMQSQVSSEINNPDTSYRLQEENQEIQSPDTEQSGGSSRQIRSSDVDIDSIDSMFDDITSEDDERK